MATVASGESPYCSVAQFLQRYDVRVFQQLLSDTGSSKTSNQVNSDAALNALLMQASGMVESAATRAGAYRIDPTATPPVNDLEALADTNSGEMLAGLVAGIAVWLVYQRRPDPNLKTPEAVKFALEQLDLLAKGERIFGILENSEAGKLGVDVESAATVVARNGIVVQSQRLFGVRANRQNG